LESASESGARIAECILSSVGCIIRGTEVIVMENRINLRSTVVFTHVLVGDIGACSLLNLLERSILCTFSDREQGLSSAAATGFRSGFNANHRPSIRSLHLTFTMSEYVMSDLVLTATSYARLPHDSEILLHSSGRSRPARSPYFST